MAYPERPMHLPIRLELALGADPAGDPAGWTWTDVTQDVVPQTISISRGRSSESSTASPASATLTLDNGHGYYTPGHPLSPHYPHVRQGTPARLWVQAGERHLLVPDASGARAQTAAPLTPPTDLDIRVELALDLLPAQVADVPPAGSGLIPWAHQWQEVAGQYRTSTNDRSWMLAINNAGGIALRWSANGATFQDAQMIAGVPYASGQRWAVRCTLDVDNGSGGWTLRGYHAPTIDGPWTVLGETTATSTTALHSAPVPVELADISALLFPRAAGRYYRVQMRSSIDGPVLTDVDFTTATPGETTVTDPLGVTWQLQGRAAISDWRCRLVGQVDEWSPTWPYGDLSEGDYRGEARIAVTVSGILRRLGAGAPPLQSTLRRYIPTRGGLTAYWPMEDGAESTSAASALPALPALRTSGLAFAAASDLPSSAPLPTVGQNGGSIQQRLPPLPEGSTGWRVEMVYHVDTLPETPTEMMSVDVSGGFTRIVGLMSRTEFRLELWRENELTFFASVTDAAAIAAATGWCRARIAADPFGGQTRYRFSWAPIGIEGTYWAFRTAMPYSTPSQVNCRWTSAWSGMAVGHVTCTNQPLTDVYGGDVGGADDAWRGERAISRMRRLAQEERLPMSVPGAPAESVRMGPQRIATLLELLQECADADGGILAERREVAGLQYRPRHLLYNQVPGLQLAARDNEIDEPFAPILDDQRLRNDITATRVDGSSARATDQVSVQQHGLYDDAVTLNVATDDQMPDLAGWLLHRGTWPGMRYPAVTTALDIAPHTAEEWMDRAEGDRLQVTDLPPQHPPGPVDLMAEGFAETVTPTRWSIEATASPAGPWTIGEVDPEAPGEETAPVHVDTDGSELAAPVGEGDTMLSVVATVGPSWTTDPTDLPWDITVGGECMTVTAVGEPGGATWDAAGARHEGQTSTAIVAPSVAGPGLLVCAWQGFGQVGDTPYQLPAGMTAGTQVAGFYVRSAAAWQSIAAGPSGTRTAAIAGPPDAWSALSIRAAGGAVAGTWVALGSSADATLVTSTASVGQWLLATVGWDWDPGDAMVPPSGGGWQQLAVSGPPGNTSSRLMAWARPVTVAGPQAVTGYSASSITDTHLRVWLLDGIPPATAQPFTVIRSVNGIRKPHPAGADVRLADPMIVAL